MSELYETITKGRLFVFDDDDGPSRYWNLIANVTFQILPPWIHEQFALNVYNSTTD